MRRRRQNGQASPRWAFMEPFDIMSKDDPDAVYLHRLRLLQTPFFAVYLHDLNLPDTDRDPHDHPWSFISIVLRGGYEEATWLVQPGKRLVPGAKMRRKTWHRFSAHKMGFDHAHMIESVQPGTKTLILTGPRKKSWGFYTDGEQGVGYLDWRPYLGVEE